MPIKVHEQTEKVMERVTGNNEYPVDDPSLSIYEVRWFYDALYSLVIGCNLQCPYCWVNPQVLAGLQDSPYVTKKRQNLPKRFRDNILTDADDLFQYLAQRIEKKGYGRIGIGGGESSLYRGGIARIGELAQQEELQVIVDTNGTVIADLDDRLDSEYLDSLEGLQDTITFDVSIRGTSPERFERSSNGEGNNYRAPFVTLRKLLSRGFRAVPSTLVNTLATREELKQEENPVTQLFGELSEIHPLLPSVISARVMTTLVQDRTAFKGKMRKSGYQNTAPSAVDKYLRSYFADQGAPLVKWDPGYTTATTTASTSGVRT